MLRRNIFKFTCFSTTFSAALRAFIKNYNLRASWRGPSLSLVATRRSATIAPKKYGHDNQQEDIDREVSAGQCPGLLNECREWLLFG